MAKVQKSLRYPVVHISEKWVNSRFFIGEKNGLSSPAITHFFTKKNGLWIHNPVFSPKQRIVAFFWHQVDAPRKFHRIELLDIPRSALREMFVQYFCPHGASAQFTPEPRLAVSRGLSRSDPPATSRHGYVHPMRNTTHCETLSEQCIT